MKKLMIGLAVISLLGTAALPAGAAKSRVETFEYSGVGQIEGDSIGVWVGGFCVQQACFDGSTEYKTLKNEKAVSVKIVDDQGAKVRAIVYQNKGIYRDFCGSSGKLPIQGGKRLDIWISANPCGAAPDGLPPTQGTITTTFFK
jgi:hypothetical protein